MLLVTAAALQVSCGLPDAYFLAAPVLTSAAATGTGNFPAFSNPAHALTGTQDLNVTFMGNELYYRFYTFNELPSINANVYDSTNPADPSTQLQNAGFLPVRSPNDLTGSPSIPLIAIDAALGAAGSTVTVVLSPLAAANSSTFTVSGGGPSLEIRRNVFDTVNPSNTGHYRVFATNPNMGSILNYGAADADMQPIDSSSNAPYIQINQNSTVYVAMYALSYGLSVSSAPIRSAPVYLGYAPLPNF